MILYYEVHKFLPEILMSEKSRFTRIINDKSRDLKGESANWQMTKSLEENGIA